MMPVQDNYSKALEDGEALAIVAMTFASLGLLWLLSLGLGIWVDPVFLTFLLNMSGPEANQVFYQMQHGWFGVIVNGVMTFGISGAIFVIFVSGRVISNFRKLSKH